MKQIVKLTNGLRVGNFSSPHDFVFEDGTVLPAVSDDKSRRLKVDFIERFHAHQTPVHCSERIDIVSLNFELSGDVFKEISEWIGLSDEGHVDLVLCPLPMITALKKDKAMLNSLRVAGHQYLFVAVRIADRVKKQLYINKFSW